MSSKAADRIHAMQEKGILTPEQAEELLKRWRKQRCPGCPCVAGAARPAAGQFGARRPGIGQRLG